MSAFCRGVLVGMERPVVGYGVVCEGGHDDKGKIQTGQSFPFANRAPDKGSACSSTDRRPISLLLPLLYFSLSLSLALFSPLFLSSSFSWQLVCEGRGGESLSHSHRQRCHQAATAQQLISLQLLLKGQAGTGR